MTISGATVLPMLFCIAQPVAKGAHDMTIATPIAAVRALFFDVFGTLVDFRTRSRARPNGC